MQVIYNLLFKISPTLSHTDCKLDHTDETVQECNLFSSSTLATNAAMLSKVLAVKDLKLEAEALGFHSVNI